MKRILLALVLLCLVLMSVWYFVFKSDDDVEIQTFPDDVAAIEVLTPEATKQDVWSAIAHFETSIDETKGRPRSYSYYGAALSMKALYQSSPLDKQASSSKASVVFTEIMDSYPDQALSVLFEAIALARSPEFLQLGEKSQLRLNSAWKIMESDAADGNLSEINSEALGIMVQFLPIFEKIYTEQNLLNDAFGAVSENARALESSK